MQTTERPAPDAGRTAAWSDRLRSHGRRVTKQRLAVLDAVERRPHSTAEDVVAEVRAVLPAITVQSVYVVLSDLTAVGMLRKFEPPASPALYETRTGDNHHHAYCVRCGAVVDVDCAVGHAPCLTPSEHHGMRLLAADVVYQGICADCLAAAPAPPPDAD
ncbi:Fur family transcriptional regulator [Kocuria turfanensis]|uniref:Ferric uptake regulation protein FurA n=1 Tax=Kocuria turfanensis TaxID=388357 RepID=A0A512IB58_9MICC|nr:Fur family transcriptional regulator [Kocuria turfanensis]GEO94930.1 ferric uptake regulation protein FurA [Kocuria turfanensis]